MDQVAQAVYIETPIELWATAAGITTTMFNSIPKIHNEEGWKGLNFRVFSWIIPGDKRERTLTGQGGHTDDTTDNSA